MKKMAIALALTLAPVAAHAQLVTNRTTVTTINPGTVANFSGATYTYANTFKFNSTAGIYSAAFSIQPNATNIVLAGLGTTTVVPPTVSNGSTSVNYLAVTPGGTGQGYTIGYSGNDTGFLAPAVIGGKNALTFSGGGENLVDTGGVFDSFVKILGDYSSAASHTTATYGSGFTVLQNFVYSNGYTTFEVETKNYQGINPAISFSIFGIASPTPEPATWAMMILGFGAVGFALRRRGQGVGTAALA